MSDRRAIIVEPDDFDGGRQEIEDYWLAAGPHQPRIPYCLTHGYPLSPGSPRTWCECGEQYGALEACRIVEAIVVPTAGQT